jgi:hypothetical protein
MLRIKPGVKLAGMSPQIGLAIQAAMAIWTADGDTLTITSVNDGRHSHTSLHYSGQAVDLRTRDLSDPQRKADLLGEALGVDFDVLFEVDHIHVEYQPRYAAK